MKKNILILSTAIIVLSLLAFGFINGDQSESDQLKASVSEDVASNVETTIKIENKVFNDFIYDVGPRFWAVKKDEVHMATSFGDFIGEEHVQRIVSYKYLSVMVYEDGKRPDKKEINSTGILTEAQLKILRSSDYSTNLLIWADYIEKNEETGELEDAHWTPHITVVPEKQAEYSDGKEALKEYLKESSKESRVNVDPNKLQPAKLFFTVTKKGKIENVKLDRTSNYPEVDKTMIELITKTQGKWQPAENSKGEKVDQELVVSFGLMGC